MPDNTATAPSAPVTNAALFYEYTSSANPQASGIISPIPFRDFPAALYAGGATRVVALDLSAELACPGPATGPGLCASFVRINAADALTFEPTATSQVFYVIGGAGTVVQGDTTFAFSQGDFFTLPGGVVARLQASVDAALYNVNDAPLLAYLGVTSVAPRFAPTLYPAAHAEAALRKVADAPNAAKRNRISVLLGNTNFPQTRTVTHTLWAMYGLITPASRQKPHRHQSIALDFIVDCQPGCYSLVGTRVDDNGDIINPTRVDWSPGMAFVTPPGYWHAHVNESDREARLIPIQDAGLLTYLRALDIRFVA